MGMADWHPPLEQAETHGALAPPDRPHRSDLHHFEALILFPVVRVTQPPDAPEQLGTKKKYWYMAEDGRWMLFKAEERGYGEDWSEKIVCELAGLLGIPHVHYELAR